MFVYTNPGLYQSKLLNSLPHVFHGYTDRKLGDMKKNMGNRQKVLALFPLKTTLVVAEQVHGNRVGFIHETNDVDGLVWKKKKNETVALGVVVADCVPMVLVDPTAHIIAVAHAGWKGTLGNITSKTVDRMKAKGGSVENIFASIGPHISMCHYTVPQERAEKFLDAYGNDPKVASFFEHSWHIDIGWANYRQLIDAGIRADHIDAPPTCTACQIDRFFSYRIDTKETFGEIMGVIGMI